MDDFGHESIDLFQAPAGKDGSVVVVPTKLSDHEEGFAQVLLAFCMRPSSHMFR